MKSSSFGSFGLEGSLPGEGQMDSMFGAEMITDDMKSNMRSFSGWCL